MSTIIAEFAIYRDDLNPSQITELLGIKPSTTWMRGDLRNRRTNATYDYGCWKISTEENGLSLESHVRLLMTQLSSCENVIVSLAADGCEIEVAAIIKFGEESPDISVSKEAIAWMCGIRASLDIDI